MGLSNSIAHLQGNIDLIHYSLLFIVEIIEVAVFYEIG